jgi:hypothetical protein
VLGYPSCASAKGLRIFVEIRQRPLNEPTYLLLDFRYIASILWQRHPARLYRLSDRTINVARPEHFAHLFHGISLVVVIATARVRDGMMDVDCHESLLVRDNVMPLSDSMQQASLLG